MRNVALRLIVPKRVTCRQCWWENQMRRIHDGALREALLNKKWVMMGENHWVVMVSVATKGSCQNTEQNVQKV